MRKRLSPGVILGVVAVVFACAGSATAGSLITSGKIKDGTIQGRDIKKGTITSDRLASSVQSQLKKTGKTGATGAPGAKGDTGAAGSSGATIQGSAPQPGEKGEKGEKGDAGVNGINPATLVAKSGDAGWEAIGGAGTSGYPRASVEGGELRLRGGHDSASEVGAIGFWHLYESTPALSSLKTLSYDFRVLKRPNPNSAPTLHITVIGANVPGSSTGWTNLVFEPYSNGDFGVNQRYSIDALAGQWWVTAANGAGGIPRQKLVSMNEFLAANPNTKVRAISVDNGGTSGTDTVPGDAFAAAADNLIVGFGSTFTRYDFGG
jgi:hypothetical protein